MKLSLNLKQTIIISSVAIIGLSIWAYRSHLNIIHHELYTVNKRLHGCDSLGSFESYYYDCSKHITEPDSAPINVNKYNAIKEFMSVKRIIQIMQIPPAKQDNDAILWVDKDAYIKVHLRNNRAILKERNFVQQLNDDSDEWEINCIQYDINENLRYVYLINRKWQKPFVSINGRYGQGPIDDDTGYLYDRNKRLVQKDNARISLPNFDRIQVGMTEEQVMGIFGQTYLDHNEAHWVDGPAGIYVEFDNNHCVACKIRNFDGEHESPDRWNDFWKQSHDVIPGYYGEKSLNPSLTGGN